MNTLTVLSFIKTESENNLNKCHDSGSINFTDNFVVMKGHRYVSYENTFDMVLD